MSRAEISAGTVLITGISAAGKSTLGKRLYEDLKKAGISNVELLDGERVREELERQGKRYGYTPEDRNQVLWEMAQMAVDFNAAGKVCILCTIAHQKSTRQEMRRRIGNFMEVYLECSVDVCAERDPKGHYKKALAGLLNNFVGVTEPYQTSDAVDLVVSTGSNDIGHCAKIMFDGVMGFLCNGNIVH